jgi:DNA primase
MVWAATLEDRQIDTPERRAAFQAELDRQVTLIADPAVQEMYRQEFRQRVWRMLRGPAPIRSRSGGGSGGGDRRGQARSRGGPQMPPTLPAATMPVPNPDRGLKILVATAIIFPEVLDEDAESFARLDIADPELDRLRRALLEVQDKRPRLDREGVRLHLIAAGFGGIVPRLLGSSIFKALAFVRTDDEAAARENWKKMLLELHKREASEELRRAADLGADGLTEGWARRIEEMQREVARAQEQEIDDESPLLAPGDTARRR